MERTLTLPLNPIVVKPRLIQGDAELGGIADIHVWARAEIRNGGRELWIRGGMAISEPRGDWSAGEAEESYLRLRAQGADRFVGFASDNSTEHHFRDTNWDDDWIREPSGEFVKVFHVKGDTMGNDIGTHSMCTIQFNPLQLRVSTP